MRMLKALGCGVIALATISALSACDIEFEQGVGGSEIVDEGEVDPGASEIYPEDAPEPEDPYAGTSRETVYPDDYEVDGNATVTAIIDGDTIHTTAGRVRLIGIDAPEKDECGGDDSTDYLAGLIPVGSLVDLVNPSEVDDTDKYGRLLRYVDREYRPGHVLDAGYSMISAGYADPRYDSQDGYDWHPREDEYHWADQNDPSKGNAAVCQVFRQAGEDEDEYADDDDDVHVGSLIWIARGAAYPKSIEDMPEPEPEWVPPTRQPRPDWLDNPVPYTERYPDDFGNGGGGGGGSGGGSPRCYSGGGDTYSGC